MFLKLCSPQSRNRKHWTARGTYKGQRYDYSTGETLKSEAQKVAEDMEREIRDFHDGKQQGDVTFTDAAKAFITSKQPGKRNEEWIIRAAQYIGDMPVDQITQHVISATALAIYPKASAATRNRAVVRPIASVLHYAAKNKWCPWLRIDAFKEPPPETRYVENDVQGKLLKATKADPDKNLLILWLFEQGNRITEALSVRYEDCDLENATVSLYIFKSNRRTTVPLDAEICRILKDRGTQEGFVFPWRTRWGVYKWLTPLKKRLGVEFTPHMARHTLGKRLNDGGVSVRTTMLILNQKDMKSAMRYQTTDVESMRAAKIGVKSGVGRKKHA